ncbi:MAG: class I SAM-dependent methyltransferase [Myxococcota bacterium]
MTTDPNAPIQGGADKIHSESTEFWVPKGSLDVRDYIKQDHKQGTHHLGRYTWALPVVKGRKRILDIACGAGYGSKLMADAHPESEIVGVDYDGRAVAHAREHYRADNLRFEAGNMVRWEIENGKSLGQFDCIVSFDTIEHLLHREIALLNFAENLSADGMLLLSTPCGKAEDLLNPGWEHHKIEYSSFSLHNLLRRFFGEVLHTAAGTLPNQAFWDEVINGDRPRYLNKMNPAVCLKPIQLAAETGRAPRP